LFKLTLLGNAGFAKSASFPETYQYGLGILCQYKLKTDFFYLRVADKIETLFSS